MKTVTLCMILLGSAWSFSAAAADPPVAPAKSTPAPAPVTAPGASSTAPTTAPAAKAPGTSPQPASVPDRIEPTEKLHADSEISFPVDI